MRLTPDAPHNGERPPPPGTPLGHPNSALGMQVRIRTNSVEFEFAPTSHEFVDPLEFEFEPKFLEIF